MPVLIRSMTPEEFDKFYQWSVAHQAAELVKERSICLEDAQKETIAEITSMLPDGLDTKHNYLMTITEKGSGETAGFIWMLHENTTGRKQSFICDFAIWESKRRRGYASAALKLAEKHAVDSGCLESVLFVADENTAARALYEKCGYRILRKAQYGKYMIKQLL